MDGVIGRKMVEDFEAQRKAREQQQWARRYIDQGIAAAEAYANEGEAPDES